ncbi:MAG: hypothetical protein ACTHK7_14980 [Aureliella sp.]
MLAVLIMSDLEPNPYSPPLQGPDAAALATRWRVIPAAASFLIGLASFTLGIAAVGITVNAVVLQSAKQPLGLMIAGCSLYLGFGIAWIVAGRLYWRGRYRAAAIANGVGILFPVVLFAILGV